jgi:hypothetical protein
MFTKEDFVIEDTADLMGFLIILPFVGLIAPFLIAAYKIGFVQEVTGWMDNQ